MHKKIIDGKKLSDTLRENIAIDIKAWMKQGNDAPRIAIIKMGEDPASKIYFHEKIKACKKAGIQVTPFLFDEEVTEIEVLDLIQKLNKNEQVHGIFVELPLPQSIDVKNVIQTISPGKDVDGLHPFNLGYMTQGTMPHYLPCTAASVLQLLDSLKTDLTGKNAVVIGAKNGKFIALSLLARRCTITNCHIHTKNLAQHVRQADILVSAAGVAHLIKGEWIKPGAIVIDVGISQSNKGELLGDVEFQKALPRVQWITPVPGGVGPMTVSMLMQNTLTAAKRQQAHHD